MCDKKNLETSSKQNEQKTTRFEVRIPHLNAIFTKISYLYCTIITVSITNQMKKHLNKTNKIEWKKPTSTTFFALKKNPTIHTSSMIKKINRLSQFFLRKCHLIHTLSPITHQFSYLEKQQKMCNFWSYLQREKNYVLLKTSASFPAWNRNIKTNKKFNTYMSAIRRSTTLTIDRNWLDTAAYSILE